MAENVGFSQEDWDEAKICVWKIDAESFPDTEKLVEHIETLIDTLNEAKRNSFSVRLADHRTVYYSKDDKTFRIASWFCDTELSALVAAYESAEKFLPDGFVAPTPINFTYGREFTERSTCIASCLKVADTVKGKLKRQALLENLLKLYGQGPCGMGG